MSTQISPATNIGGGPADAALAGQRVQQLQAMIAQAQQGTAATAPGSFAAALDAANSSTPAADGLPLAGAASATLPGAALTASSPAPATSAFGAIPTLPTSSTATSPPGQYDSLVQQAAARYGLDPAVLHGLIEQESGFDPNAHSSAGAEGLTQLMPGTASSLGVSNPLDPAQSIDGGARYLSGLLKQFGGNTQDALAAYNAGPGAVQRYGGIPPYAETQNYVTKVLGYANAYRQSAAGASLSTPAATSAAVTDPALISPALTGAAA